MRTSRWMVDSTGFVLTAEDAVARVPAVSRKLDRPQSPRRSPVSGLVLLAAVLSASLMGGCSDGSFSPAAQPLDPPGPADDLSLTDAWLVGTHNSYWVDRGVSADVFASGVQESLLDQLVPDKGRALEL